MLVNLEYLSCSDNQLQGTIRPTLTSAMTRVSTLWLDGNALTGSIPAMGAMTVLRSWCVSDNQLTGPLPPDWFSSPRLRFMDFSYNNLNGMLPPVQWLCPGRSWAHLSPDSVLQAHCQTSKWTPSSLDHTVSS